MVAKAGICTAVKDDGTPCQARARSKSSFCVFHDPEAEELRRAARRNGGITRNRPATVLPIETVDPKLVSVNDVGRLLADTICRVRKGELDPRVANTVGYLAGIMLKALDMGELERRVAALEDAARAARVSDSPDFDPNDPPLPAELEDEREGAE